MGLASASRDVVRTNARDLFAIDLRSLAFFRIGAGLTLAIDILWRLPNARAFYSDEGVLPRSVLIERFANPWHLGLLMINGQPQIMTMIFCGGFLLALQLMIGYRSRLAAFLCWLFVISVQSRNAVVIHAGDEVMRLLFFWSWLLPLGARYSVDHAANPDRTAPSAAFASVASAGLILQICFIYWFNAIHKLHPVWYREASAIHYALNLDILASSFGKWLLGFPALLPVLTRATLAFEFGGPLLIFVSPTHGGFRLLASLAFIAFHLGLAMSFHLGSLPWIACVGWIAILPGVLWDRLAAHFGQRTFARTRRIRQELVAWVAKRRPWPAEGANGLEPRWPAFRPSLANQLFSCAALLLITAWNVSGLRNETGVALGSPWWEIGSILQINQKWSLFAPYPATDDGWYVVDAELFDGERIDPLRDGSRVSWQKPASVAEVMKDSMWRKYLMNIWRENYSQHRLYLGRYLCRAWNSAHENDRRIKTMHMYYMLETTPPPGETLPPPERTLVWRHYCFDKPADW